VQQREPCLTRSSFLQGVTGLGSAILNLCTWIIFVVAGVKAGKLFGDPKRDILAPFEGIYRLET
jgi:hypothetical protein